MRQTTDRGPKQRPVVSLKRKNKDWSNYRSSAARLRQQRSSEQNQKKNSKLRLRFCVKPKQNNSSRWRKHKLRQVVSLRTKNNAWPNKKPSADRPKRKGNSEPRKNSGLRRELRSCAR